VASWVLVPCLTTLRDEFNQLAPNRDHASDGSVGDTAHASSSSDHNPDETGNTPSEDADARNEVHAIDVDDDLRRAGWTMNRCLAIIIDRHRTGVDDRLQNVIYNRRIWSRSWGWTARVYTGSNAHTEHAHFSARYTTAQENDTRPWGLLAEDDDVSAADVIAALKSAEGRELVARAVWETDGVVSAPDGAKNADGTPNVHWLAESYLTGTYAAAVAARNAAVAGLQVVKDAAARDDVDEVALAAALGPAVGAFILANLPQGADHITQDEVNTAVEAAFRDAFSG
jgi:hypothetical protein